MPFASKKEKFLLHIEASKCGNTKIHTYDPKWIYSLNSQVTKSLSKDILQFISNELVKNADESKTKH
jgi:hypothetical protein